MTSIATLPRPAVDLRGFKHTLPIGSAEHPTEIYPISHWPWFEPTSVTFRAHAGGVTTSGSDYPRSELREIGEWDSRRGVHQLRAALAINRLTRVKPDVVPLQIHDGSDDVAQVRLEGRRLFVESDGDEIGDLDTAYMLGSKFYIRMVADRDGIRIRHQRSGSTKIVERKIRRTGSGWYFKAGLYLQSNVDEGDNFNDYAEDRFDLLQLDHAA